VYSNYDNHLSIMKRQITMQSFFTPKEKVLKNDGNISELVELSTSSSTSRATTTATQTSAASEDEESDAATSQPNLEQTSTELMSELQPKEVKWPTVWTMKQCTEFAEKYPWLTAENGALGCTFCKDAKTLGAWKQERISLSTEWVTCSIQVTCSAEDPKEREKTLSALRGKIKKHNDSAAHKLAVDIRKRKDESHMENAAKKLTKVHIEKTEAVFRTVYHLAKMNRPFTDHDDLIHLQQLNGLDMGRILHSRYSATTIACHIAHEMQKKIVENIVNSNEKLAVLIDESTSLSQKSVMVVHLKTCFTKDDVICEPEMIFLTLCELQNQTAEEITDCLLQSLKSFGFTDEYLKENWIAFVSDGASVMMGRSSGVAKRLLDIYPNLFVWHCLNHRLELAVNDAVDEVGAINHFKIFLESLYSLYSRSSKNKRELQKISDEVHSQCLKIGRVLDVRWVSSSFRTVSAVYKSFAALCRHFEMCSEDGSRDSRERQKFRGLLNKLSSQEFLQDLGLMFDTLHELSQLSLELQRSGITLPQADRAIKRTVRVLHSFKDEPGEKMSETTKAVAEESFQNIRLHSNPKSRSINQKQFIQSLVNNMESRLVNATCAVGGNTDKVLQDLRVLEKETWPEEISIRYGEAEIRRLSTMLQVNVEEAIRGMRALVDGESDPESLKPLRRAVDTIPCSSAQCERDFSLMNLICSETRSTLLVSNIANLMIINANGPPLPLWKPTQYVESWLLRHRSADATNSRTVNREESPLEKFVWNIL